ncbi:hypothetical protein CPB83DRAFT_852826 [Crepidotus variabilis]|uniref:C2H2-type domain-containing protein n=1 Tax=Crepidotus variabilis TaxID=179855 RepID=A0A9P6JQT8_9AGAR|nr:hypothetical protein CPB83DRAFT_852826 [Crepidotus variabilis]
MVSTDTNPSYPMYPAVAVHLPQGLVSDNHQSRDNFTYELVRNGIQYTPQTTPSSLSTTASHMSPQRESPRSHDLQLPQPSGNNPTELYIQSQHQQSQPPLPAPPSPTAEQAAGSVAAQNAAAAATVAAAAVAVANAAAAASAGGIGGSPSSSGSNNGTGAGANHYPSSSGVPRLPPILQVEKQQVTTSATQLASASRRRNEAHFVCPVPGCGSTFTRRFNLRGHLRSHTEERPYVCEWPGCKKGFARQHDCKRHQALHAAKSQNNVCQGCKKTFSRLDALNRHLRSDGGAECRQHNPKFAATFAASQQPPHPQQMHHLPPLITHPHPPPPLQMPPHPHPLQQEQPDHDMH